MYQPRARHFHHHSILHTSQLPERLFPVVHSEHIGTSLGSLVALPASITVEWLSWDLIPRLQELLMQMLISTTL